MQLRTALATPTTSASPRRHDIDSLRVLAMLGVFFFHCARFFDPLPWHLKNPDKSLAAFIFIGFLNCFQMPLLMLLSGSGSWFALRSHGGGVYLLDRIKRLLVPVYTVGLFLLIPPQYYWELVTNNHFTGSLRQFLPLYFQTFDLHPTPHFLAYWSGHLWFLHTLFVISFLTLPLLLLLNSHSARRLISALAALADRPAGIFLFVLPIAAVRVGLPALLRPGHALIEFFNYAVFFLIGYCLMAHDRFTHSLRRHTPLLLVLAPLTFLSMAFWVLHFHYEPWQIKLFDQKYGLFMLLDSLNTWSWIALFLSLANRHLNTPSPTLSYCNEAVLPFYILHQTLILTVGYFIIRLPLGIAPKYVLIAILSFAAILSLYEFLIRRLNPLRVLFGMRITPTPKPQMTNHY